MEAAIRELLQEHGVSFKTNGKSFIMACPRCAKAGKLYIRRRDGRFVCWYCGEAEGFHGRPEYALLELCQIPLADIRKSLYGDAGSRPGDVYLDLDLADFEDEGEYLDQAPTLPTVEWPHDFFPLDHRHGAKGAAYLESRGIPVAIAIEYGCRYHPASSRVVFPVQSRGQLYGWQERLTVNDKPFWDERQQKMRTPLKAKTSDGLPRDRVLMFADRLNGSRHAVLTEGPVDALKAHLCGGNVATMGKQVAASQLQLIRNAGIEKIYLGLDPDAWLEINKLRNQLSDLVVYDLRPPAPYKDLGEMGMDAVYRHFLSAPRLEPWMAVLYLKDFYGIQQ